MRKHLLVALLLFPVTLWSIDFDFKAAYSPAKYGLPSDENIVKKEDFILSYNPEYKIPHWTAHVISWDTVRSVKKFKRPSYWRQDVDVKVNPSNKDYTNSGYDRGHLVPAADLNYTERIKDTFVFSNCAPQVPQFNRGIWAALEAQTRKWADKGDVLWVYTGVHFYRGRKKLLGDNRVGVPHYWWKVIYSPQRQSAVAFYFENKDHPYRSYADVYDHQVPIDYIEEKAKIDLLKELPDDIEDALESEEDIVWHIDGMVMTENEIEMNTDLWR